MADQTAETIRALELMDRLRAPPLQRAIEALGLRRGSRLLDIGCGIGLHLLPLVDAAGPKSHVIGVDVAHAMLRHALRNVVPPASTHRVALTTADMSRLPFEDDSFDLCWSVDCLGYPAADSLPLLKEVVRVACRGATIAVLSWSSQQVLPGHAMLEARLNASASAYAPYLCQATPEQHFMRLGRWFVEAGIGGWRCRSFIGEVAAPLDREERLGMAALFEMLWGGSLQGGSSADQREYKRLCDPDSPDCLLGLPDYCAFFTYTMFSGSVRK